MRTPRVDEGHRGVCLREDSLDLRVGAWCAGSTPIDSGASDVLPAALKGNSVQLPREPCATAVKRQAGGGNLLKRLRVDGDADGPRRSKSLRRPCYENHSHSPRFGCTRGEIVEAAGTAAENERILARIRRCWWRRRESNLTRFSKQAGFCEFGMKSIRQKRQIRSKGLVNPQIAPSDFERQSRSFDKVRWTARPAAPARRGRARWIRSVQSIDRARLWAR